MLPAIGKLDRETFDRIITPQLGHKDERVTLGPRHGVDAAVIDLGDRVMVVAEDPTFGMPVLMPHFGWSIVHICASDVAVMGVKPSYLTICLLLPPGTSEETLSSVWKQIHEECERLEIAVVGGHTGVYPGIPYPLNGGCTVWGFGRKEELTPASAARPGDRLVITKGPAIEATGILALQAEKDLVKAIGQEVVEKAKARFLEMTVVKDALVARAFCHAMHDATEGGLLNGVFEMAEASGIGVILEEERIPLPPEIEAVCNHFQIDPMTSISEGTLVMAVPPEREDELMQAMQEQGIPAWDVGEFVPAERKYVRRDGSVEELCPVKVDPFWQAYFSTLK